VRLLGALTHLLVPKHAAGVHNKGRFAFLIHQSITPFAQKIALEILLKRKERKSNLLGSFSDHMTIAGSMPKNIHEICRVSRYEMHN